MRRKFPLIFLGVVALLTAVAYRPLCGFYHWRMMDSKRHEAIAEYEHHRDRLGALGYLEYRTYHFPDQKSANIHNWLWQRVRDRFPKNIHVMLGYPDNTLEVWAEPEKISEWDTFANEMTSELRE